MSNLPYDLRRVTRKRWLEVRPTFEQVWRHEADRVDITEMGVKIYRVGKVVRMDVKEPE